MAAHADIIVEARMDRMGNVMLTPVNARLRRRYAKHLREMGVSDDPTVFIQEASDDDLLRVIPRRLHRELEKGWPVRFKMDPWMFGSMLGYDAHDV